MRSCHDSGQSTTEDWAGVVGFDAPKWKSCPHYGKFAEPMAALV